MSTTDDLDEECKGLPGEPTGAGAPHRTSGRSLDRERRVATLLAEVLDVAAENRRRALEAKETSPEVIDRVLGILERGPGDFMAESPLGRLAEPATAEPDSERAVPGGGPPYPRIQGYEVTGLLGEGGMGRVFLGVQRSADRRPVAIKMIRASVPGAELVRRFEAERQALSRLNHPAIAQLFGAGEAADGRHFVALEYVDGLPITAYCDRNRLDVRGRLEIFIEVCRGVEHAHRRQLLHRDLKPSNLMVTRRDGRPVPKVIDFGIARPLDSDGDPTVHTGASILGSPAYMSPEAVGPSGGPRDLDTRADVYSLGVVLYELLVGVRPHGPRSSHDPLTLIRRIRDEEAPRPSSRWRALDDSTRRAFAERRGLSEPLARKVLAGDLDWITMKAIAKDREQRYGSVAELAADLERYLRDEPVSAGPPTWGYRLGKFVRRRRWLAANVALASLSLLTAVLASGVGLVRARDAARQEAEARMDAEAALDFLVRLFEASAPHAVDNRKPADQVTARELLERGSQHIETELVDQPQEAARLRRILARSYRSLGLYDEALEHLEAARARLEALEPSIEVDSQLASVLRSIGAIAVKEARPEAALDVLDRAEALTSARPAASDHDLELSLIRGRKAAALRLLARFDEAESEMKKVLALHASMPEETAHHLQVSSLNNLGMLYFQQGRWAEAEPLFARAADLARRRQGPEHPRTAIIIDNLAASLSSQGRLDEAAPLFREALEARRVALPENHHQIALSLHNLGTLALDRDRPGEAETHHREALAIRRLSLGEDHPRTAWSHEGLGLALERLGRAEPALDHLGKALGIRRAKRPGTHPDIRRSLRLLGDFHRRADDLEAASARYREALAAGPARDPEHPSPDPDGAELAVELAEVLVELGRAAEAPALVDEASARMAPDQETELRARLESIRLRREAAEPG